MSKNNCWKELPKKKQGDNPFQYKIGLNKATEVIQKLKQDLGDEGWNQIILTLNEIFNSNKYIQWVEFEEVLKANKRELQKKENDTLRPIVGEFSKNGNILNLNKLEFLSESIHNQNENLILDEEADDCKDFCTVYGYLSKTREEKITEEFTEDQLIDVLYNYSFKNSDNHFPTSILKSIRSIDIDKNGYVTYLELSNCLKYLYEKELFGKSIHKIFAPFASIQNKSLINYNLLIDHLKNKIEARKKEDANMKQETMSIVSSHKLKPLSPNLFNKKLMSEPLSETESKFSPENKIPDLLTPKRDILLSPVQKSRNVPSIAESRTSYKSSIFKNSPNRLVKTSSLATKLAYEWKFIIRDLKLKDPRNSGKVKIKDYLSILETHKVRLLKEEWRACVLEYETIDNKIDYERISKELNLHKLSYDYINPQNSLKHKISKLSKLKAPGIGEILKKSLALELSKDINE